MKTPEYKNINLEIRSLISNTVYDVLTDPDFGLDLSKKARGRLGQARKSIGAGVPFSVIKKKYALS